MSDLIERLRNPAWIRSHVSVSATAALDEEQTIADMVEAAAEIARLQEAKRRALAVADERAIEANGVRQENERLRVGQAVIAKQVGFYKPDTPDFEFVSVPLGILRRALNCVPPPYPEDGAAEQTGDEK